MVHFRLNEGGRVYAACHPYISAESYQGSASSFMPSSSRVPRAGS